MLLPFNVHSLLRALMSDNNKTAQLKAEDLTDGIDINTWTIERNGKEISYSTWDFAGQTVYYNTHQVRQISVSFSQCELYIALAAM